MMTSQILYFIAKNSFVAEITLNNGSVKSIIEVIRANYKTLLFNFFTILNKHNEYFCIIFKVSLVIPNLHYT